MRKRKQKQSYNDLHSKMLARMLANQRRWNNRIDIATCMFERVESGLPTIMSIHLWIPGGHIHKPGVAAKIMADINSTITPFLPGSQRRVQVPATSELFSNKDYANEQEVNQWVRDTLANLG